VTIQRSLIALEQGPLRQEGKHKKLLRPTVNAAKYEGFKVLNLERSFNRSWLQKRNPIWLGLHKGLNSVSRSLIAILVLSTVLRLYQIGAESLWVDEMNSLIVAEGYWSHRNAARPLYYVLLNGWMAFGHSDAWLRGLSVVFGVGCVALIFELGKQLFNRQTGLVAALLIGVSPLFINHSQEIRMYSLSSFLSLLGTLAISRCWRRDSPSQPTSPPFPSQPPAAVTRVCPAWSVVGVWAIARWLGILTTPLNLLLLAADGLLLGDRAIRDIRQWRRLWAGVLFILAGAVPTLLTQTVGGKAEVFLSGQIADYAKPGLVQIFGMITQLCVYWPLRYLLEKDTLTQGSQAMLQRDQLNDSSLIGHFVSNVNISLMFYAGLTLILLGLFGLILSRCLDRQRSFAVVALTVWALFPSVAVLAVSYISSSLWFPRYLLGFAPYYLILLAAGFVYSCRWRWVSGAIALLYSIGIIGGLLDYYGPYPYRNPWQAAAQQVSQAERPGDVIVYYSTPRYYDYSLARYYQGQNPIHLIDRPPEIASLNPDYIQQHLPDAAVTDPNSRLWLVCWWQCHDTPGLDTLAKTIAGENAEVIQSTDFTSLGAEPIQVRLVTPNSGVAHKLEADAAKQAQ
jgi:mannosyltransferase